ncbi:MAG: DUF2062 domain-containing protein [Acidobacteria bacterium]|nr:DUF2062 domain-containing protein [Acidobacteriota bacterium]
MARPATTWFTRIGRWLRLHLLRAVRENASPGRTALGLGLGAFIGIFPTLMIGTPLAFFVAGRLGLNRAAAVAGTVIAMNPVTGPFLYSLSAWLGFELLDQHRIEQEAQGMFSMLREYAVPFLLGSSVVAFTVGAILATAMFFIVRRQGGLRPLLIKPKRYQPRTPRPPADSGSIPTAP